MFRSYSCLQAEKNSWLEHTLQYDAQVRSANLSLLNDFKNGEPLFLSYTESEWGNIKFKHWFVTDRVKFLEFGSAGGDLYAARVTIDTYPREKYPMEFQNETEMNDEIRDRMRHVLGMSNYSLCLRNCEHVANYVFKGRWVSFQMEMNESLQIRRGVGLMPMRLWELYESYKGRLINIFKRHMLGSQIKLVNTFPAAIRPHVFNNESKRLYSFIRNNAQATRFDYYLDDKEDTFNILMIGPTGAGKSHLINTFFNQKICNSEASHKSVTREVYFVRGRHRIHNSETNRNEERTIIVADTIGLCDTEWNEECIIRFINGRVSSNFKCIHAVLVVFRADRLQPNIVRNIKRVLEWLCYNKRMALKFVFIGTHSDNLSGVEKRRMANEVKEMLKLHSAILPNGQEIDPVLYTGFPPEETLNNLTKERVIGCWEKLVKVLDYPAKVAPIVFKKNHLCSIL